MQFLTAKAVLYIRIIFLLFVAFYLLKDPLVVTNSNFAILLGDAMHLPVVQANKANPLFGTISVLFTFLALSDLIPVTAQNITYFETLVPARLMFAFVLGSFCLVSEYAAIANNLVFTFAFIEIWLNFLIYNNLKDEKYTRVKTYLEEHGEELRKTVDDQIYPL